MKHNFGLCGGMPLVNFKNSHRERLVLPAKFRSEKALERWFMLEVSITPIEAFRRWKIARKAWRTRKMKDQLRLPL